MQERRIREQEVKNNLLVRSPRFALRGATFRLAGGIVWSIKTSPPMATCFVIQPFDGGKFDGHYTDTFKPAMEAAGFQANLCWRKRRKSRRGQNWRRAGPLPFSLQF
jgi:hypothetical protein